MNKVIIYRLTIHTVGKRFEVTMLLIQGLSKYKTFHIKYLYEIPLGPDRSSIACLSGRRLPYSPLFYASTEARQIVQTVKFLQILDFVPEWVYLKILIGLGIFDGLLLLSLCCPTLQIVKL
jgi:hypothetical protein